MCAAPAAAGPEMSDHRPGLSKASLSFGVQHASGFFPTPPRGARAWASHDGDPRMELPSARGCYQLAPQRTSTSNPVPMPGTPRVSAALASSPATKALDPTLSPATHSVMPFMLPCCTSDLKRRFH